jgi:hypothetical protein
VLLVAFRLEQVLAVRIQQLARTINQPLQVDRDRIERAAGNAVLLTEGRLLRLFLVAVCRDTRTLHTPVQRSHRVERLPVGRRWVQPRRGSSHLNVAPAVSTNIRIAFDEFSAVLALLHSMGELLTLNSCLI